MGRPVLGRPEIIRELGRDAVLAYLHDHYGARRMVLAAAGHLDHDRVVDLAEELLGGMPAERSATTEPALYIGGGGGWEPRLRPVPPRLGLFRAPPRPPPH